MIRRVKGALFGCAIGDALGWPVEFKHIEGGSREVKSLVVDRELGAAPYTDDTQLTCCVAEALLRCSHTLSIQQAGLELAELLIAWRRDPITMTRAPGNACLAGVRNLMDGVPWRESGGRDSKGCGSVMRSSPYGLWFMNRPHRAAIYAATHSQMTHRHPAARASSAAFAAGIAVLTAGGSVVEAVPHMVTEAMALDEGTANMVSLAAEFAANRSEHTPQSILGKWKGWVADEAIAASLYCFLRHPNSYRDAVLEAVNSPGDSDSLGAITGALSGAYLGVNAIPGHWINQIENREKLANLAYRFARGMVLSGNIPNQVTT